MSGDRTVPNRDSTTARPRSGFSVPRGLAAGTLAAGAVVWGLLHGEQAHTQPPVRARAERHLPGLAPAHHL